MKSITQVLIFMILASSTFAQGFGLPPGKWWKMPRVIQRLELTRSQQDDLDQVFRRSAPELIDLNAELEKATVALRGALDRTKIDRAEIRTAGARVSQARASLFERELLMLVDMREVLNETQWNELRMALDARQSQMQDRRPPDRRRANPPPPDRRP